MYSNEYLILISYNIIKQGEKGKSGSKGASGEQGEEVRLLVLFQFLLHVCILNGIQLYYFLYFFFIANRESKANKELMVYLDKLETRLPFNNAVIKK